jgi:hypothetical protein
MTAYRGLNQALYPFQIDFYESAYYLKKDHNDLVMSISEKVGSEYDRWSEGDMHLWRS